MRPARILVLRYRFIGDTLLAIPFLRNLRAAHPDAVIDLMVAPGVSAVMAACPYINEVFEWHRSGGQRDRPLPPCRRIWPAARYLRRRGYDKIYVLRRAASAGLLAWLAGIPKRIGFATQGGSLWLTRAVPYADRHECECFLDVLRADGVPVHDTFNENWTMPVDEARVASLFPSAGKRHVLICPVSTAEFKVWPLDKWSVLLSWLINEFDCAVHFCGAPRDRRIHEQVIAAAGVLQHAPHEWSDRLSLAEAGALMRRMDLVVGIDTGLLHLAASFHRQVVGIYLPRKLPRWYPWDTRYEAITPGGTRGHRATLADVEVTEVVAAIQRMMERRKGVTA